MQDALLREEPVLIERTGDRGQSGPTTGGCQSEHHTGTTSDSGTVQFGQVWAEMN